MLGVRGSQVADASAVNDLSHRLGVLEAKMHDLVTSMTQGFEQLQRVQADPYAPYTPADRLSSSGGAGAGAGAGASGACVLPLRGRAR